MQADRSLMQAGLLDRTITIEQLAPATDDGMRVKPAGWMLLCTRKAALEPLSGSEKLAAAEKSAFQTLKFRIRRPKFTIDPKLHRIVYRGLACDIAVVEEVRRDELNLTATARADGGNSGQ